MDLAKNPTGFLQSWLLFQSSVTIYMMKHETVAHKERESYALKDIMPEISFSYLDFIRYFLAEYLMILKLPLE